MVFNTVLARLTLVIPTYNRQFFALRAMRYWSDRQGAIVHVIDGSEESLPSEKLTGLGANINYHHWPVSMAERISKIRSYITTPYVALMGDDEFYLPSGLRDCISVLDNDNELVAAIGRAVAFTPVDGRLFADLCYPEQANHQLVQETAAERMLFHFSNYTPSTIYSVVRTGAWKQAFESMARKEFPVLGQIELQFELSISCLGKSIVTPSLMWFRSNENPSEHSPDISLQIYGGLHFGEWWAKPQMSHERDEWLSIMSDVLSHGDGDGERRDLLDALYKASEAYSKYFMIRRESRKRSIRRLLPHIPRSIKSVVRWLFHKFSNQNLPLMTVIRELQKSGISVDLSEVNEIETVILASQ